MRQPRLVVKVQAVVLITLILCVSLISCGKLEAFYLKAKVAPMNSDSNLKEIRSIYHRLLKLEPENYRHHWNIGIINIRLKDKSAVQKSIKRLNDLDMQDLADDLEDMMEKELN